MRQGPRLHHRSSRAWPWTLGSGLVTLLLALAAIFITIVEEDSKSGLVGWLLVVAGGAELVLGAKRGLDLPGRAAVISGLITALSGAIFIALPPSGYIPVANVVIGWLLLRGLWIVVSAWRARARRAIAAWMGFSGIADLLLGLALILKLSIASLVLTLFGPTPEVVASFAIILAASFAATGVSQVAIAMLEKGRAGSG